MATSVDRGSAVVDPAAKAALRRRFADVFAVDLADISVADLPEA